MSQTRGANFDRLIRAAESILARNHGNAVQSPEIPTDRKAFLLHELARVLYEETLASDRDGLGFRFQRLDPGY
ncbi:hypothetical protein ACNS7O_14820 (plasmid) [Haloferacaceae archaeon DSL9]